MKIIVILVLFFLMVFLSSIAEEVWGVVRGKAGRHEERDDIFFEVVFSLLGKIAKADGHVSPDEIRVVEDFMVNVLRLTPEARVRAVQIFRSAKNDSQTIRDIAAKFFARFHRQPAMLRRLGDLLFAVAHADKHFSSHEQDLIREVLSVFGMNPRGFRVWETPPQGASPSGPYSVLNCAPGDSQEIVRRRYRELVLRYHPDRLAGKGNESSFREFATAKFREIQDAYTQIKRERGWA